MRLNIIDCLDSSMRHQFDDVMNELNRAYALTGLDAQSVAVQSFAMNLVLAREVSKLRQELNELKGSPKQEVPEPDTVSSQISLDRDNDFLIDLLALNGVEVGREIVACWTNKQYDMAENWASANQLAASDNDVCVPDLPKFLLPYAIPF